MTRIFSIAFCLSLSLYAQQAGIAVLSPVPFLKPDGSIPDGYPPEGVYLDVRAGQAVATYRSTLPSGGIGAGPLRKLVVPVSAGLNPTLTATSSIGPSGINYEFAVNNAQSSRQGIRLFRLSDPMIAPITWQDAPSGWSKQVGPSSISWLAEEAVPLPIAPGAQQRFRLTSMARPGLIRALVQGESIGFRPPSDIPKPVADELAKVLHISFNSHAFLTFGPKYPPDQQTANIAADLLAGIEFLAQLKQVELRSPYLRELGSILGRISEGTSAPESVRLATSPTTPREREIDNAIRISLGIN